MGLAVVVVVVFVADAPEACDVDAEADEGGAAASPVGAARAPAFVAGGGAAATEEGAIGSPEGDVAAAAFSESPDPPFTMIATPIAMITTTPSTAETTVTIARRDELFHSACVTEEP